MIRFALFVKLEAKPGKEPEVERLLRGGLSVVQDEPGTLAWFALRLGPSTYGIFDAFADEAGRDAHLAGRVAAALMAKANELLAQPPSIERWMYSPRNCRAVRHRHAISPRGMPGHM